MVRYFKQQRYAKLRKAHQQKGSLFEDPEFTASASSLAVDGKQTDSQVEWRRPNKIVENPKLVVDCLAGNELRRGEDSSMAQFVAACAVLADTPSLWNRVIVGKEDQDWDAEHPEKYAGIFCFRFWQMGDWVEVVIDDLLPTTDDRLVYSLSSKPNEFWPALVQKAYAKLVGSYQHLSTRNLGDCLVDLTGGISNQLELLDFDCDEKQEKLFQSLDREMQREAHIRCLIQPKDADQEEEVHARNGLVQGQLYSVTAVKNVEVQKGEFAHKTFKLVRLRGPSGATEWAGPWSDCSLEWQNVSEAERDRLGLSFGIGEFWMAFSDFLANFTSASISRLLNGSVGKDTSWFESKFGGEWVGNSAGGCIHNKATFFKNPQYTFSVSTVGGAAVIVDLLQEERDEEKLSIGFHIFQVEENRRHRLQSAMETAGEVTFTTSRSVYKELALPEGRFVVIPSTMEPSKDGRFLLRIYSQHRSDIRLCQRLAVSQLHSSLWKCWLSQYRAVLRLHVDSVTRTGSAYPLVVGGGNGLYCAVTCEGKTARTPVQPKIQTTVFNSRFVFFIRRPHQMVTIEVKTDGDPEASFIGEAVVTIAADGQTRRKWYRLHAKSMPSRLLPGEVLVSAVCDEDLTLT